MGVVQGAELTERQPPARGLVRTAIEYLPSVIVPAVCNIVLIAIFGRRLGTEEMGFYYLAQSVINIGAILAGSWIQQSLLRFESGTPLAGHRRIHVAILACMPFTGLVFVGAAAALRAAGSELPLTTAIGCLVVSEAWFRLLLAVLQSQGKSRAYSVAMSTLSLGRVVLGIAFFRAGVHDASCLLYGWLATELAVCVLVFFVLGYHRNREPIAIATLPRELVPRLRLYASYGLPMLGFVLLSELRPFTDRMVLAHLLERSAVGIHGSNYALGINSVGLLSMPLMLAVHPYLMSLANRPEFDPREFGRRTAELARAFLLLCTLLVLGVVPMSRFVSRLALGAQFERGFRILSLAALGSVFSGLVVYLSKGLEARKHTRAMLACNVMAYVASATVNIVCVWQFGLIGAALGYAVGGAIYCAIVWGVTDPEIRAPLPWATLATFGVSYAAAFCVPEVLGASWTTLLVSAAAGIIGLAVLYMRRELDGLLRLTRSL